MSTIDSYCLKPFVYSLDGYTEIPVGLHERFNCPEKYFEGLNKAGYIRRFKIGDGHVSLKPEENKPAEKIAERVVEAAPEKAVEATTVIADNFVKSDDASAVEIPDEWRSLKFFALRSLASKFGETPKNMEEAVAAIEAELARRNKD